MASVSGLKTKASVVTNALINNPRELPYASKWIKSLLPGHSPLTDKLPWYTFRAIEQLNEYLDKNKLVFEYGSGASTLYFAQNAKHVVAIEHDEEWYNILSSILQQNSIGNVDLFFIPPKPLLEKIDYNESSYTSFMSKYNEHDFKNYVKKILDYPPNSFDLICIDGRSRASCFPHALERIKNGGKILLDNSERPKYEYGKRVLKKFNRYDYYGLVPGNFDLYQTSIWDIN